MRLVCVKDWIDVNFLDHAPIKVLTRYLVERSRCNCQNDYIVQEIQRVQKLVDKNFNDAQPIEKLRQLVALQLKHYNDGHVGLTLRRLQKNPSLVETDEEVPVPVLAYFGLHDLVSMHGCIENLSEDDEHTLFGNVVNTIASANDTNMMEAVISPSFRIGSLYREDSVAAWHSLHNFCHLTMTALARAATVGNAEMLEFLLEDQHLSKVPYTNRISINHAALLAIANYQNEAWDVFWKQDPIDFHFPPEDLSECWVWWEDMIRFSAQYSNRHALIDILEYIKYFFHHYSPLSDQECVIDSLSMGMNVAVRKGDIVTVRIIQDFGISLDVTPKYETLPAGAYASTVEIFREFESEMDSDLEPNAELILFHHCRAGNPHIVVHLMENQVTCAEAAATAILGAIGEGHADIVHYILNLKDGDLLERTDLTEALKLARENGRIEISILLEEAMA